MWEFGGGEGAEGWARSGCLRLEGMGWDGVGLPLEWRCGGQSEAGVEHAR